MPLPAAAYASSNFLTSPAGQGLASAAGGMLGGLFGKGPSIAKQMRDHRMLTTQNYKLQDKYGGIAQRARQAKAAGLHPLAALGISTGGTGASTQGQYSPGQSSAGSAIESGINTYLGAQRAEQQAGYNRSMQRMQIEEQRLRNEFLATQIANSKVKTVANLANVTQDAIALKTLVRGAKMPPMVKPAERYPHVKTGQVYNLFGKFPIRQRPGKLTVEGMEDAGGDPGAWAYSPFSIVQDIGYTLDLMKTPEQRWGARKLPINVGGPQP